MRRLDIERINGEIAVKGMRTKDGTMFDGPIKWTGGLDNKNPLIAEMGATERSTETTKNVIEGWLFMAFADTMLGFDAKTDLKAANRNTLILKKVLQKILPGKKEADYDYWANSLPNGSAEISLKDLGFKISSIAPVLDENELLTTVLNVVLASETLGDAATKLAKQTNMQEDEAMRMLLALLGKAGIEMFDIKGGKNLSSIAMAKMATGKTP
jgi:hypothetical protein